jgi:radical SAM/Cys-rich protein
MSNCVADRSTTGDIARLPTFCFKERIEGIDPSFARFETLRTLQLNLGNRCNLACAHCHVGASPTGKEVMGKEVIDAVVAFLHDHDGITLDITGGCPELNPNFPYLVTETDGLDIRRLVRTNLVITTEPGMTGLPEFYRDHGLALVASLPCFTAENVNRQRGDGVFEGSIAALRRLNDLGYGDTLELTLVYNPGGDALPGPEKELETLYRKELMAGYGIRFSRLFTLTNVPIGRFQDQLAGQGVLARYLRTLAEHFNPVCAPSLMCRSLISVDWKGNLYNCDFNQAVQMVLTDGNNIPLRIDGLDRALQKGIPMRFNNHCFACTAGEGSSCFGQYGNIQSGQSGTAVKDKGEPDQFHRSEH